MELRRVGWGFIPLYTLAFMSTSLVFIAPLLVTLALKVNSLVGIEQAPNSLSVVTGTGALLAIHRRCRRRRGVTLGAFLEVLLIIANVGTAVALVAIHDRTFLLGPGFIVGVGNGLILGWLMYRSGLVPRGMAMLGLVAGPVLLAGGTAALLGVIEPDSAPEFVWELSLGIYLMVKGFKPSPITAATTAGTTPSAPREFAV